MSPSASSALIQWFVDYFSGSSSSAATSTHGGCPALGGIVYEMFGLGDAFGRVMLSNLQVLSPFSYHRLQQRTHI